MKMQTDTLDIPLLIRLIEENPEWRALFRRALLSDDMLELPELFRRLSAHVEAIAEAQWQIKEVIRDLAEAQRRTDESVKALAEAQRRTEQRVEELAEAQRRTDERVDVLAQKVDHLSVEVNNLRRTIGATVEEEAEDWVLVLLEQKGYQILEEPRQVRMDGEVDVAIPVARDGQALWAVVEAKTRLSRREIEDWANRMRSEGFRQRLAQHGVPGPYLVYIYGLRVDAACDAAARQFGIGLVTGRGERVPPGPLLPPAESEGEEN